MYVCMYTNVYTSVGRTGYSRCPMRLIKHIGFIRLLARAQNSQSYLVGGQACRLSVIRNLYTVNGKYKNITIIKHTF